MEVEYPRRSFMIVSNVLLVESRTVDLPQLPTEERSMEGECPHRSFSIVSRVLLVGVRRLQVVDRGDVHDRRGCGGLMVA